MSSKISKWKCLWRGLKSDKREGKGILLAYWEIDEGEFKDDKKEGKGVLNCVDILITANSKMIKEMEKFIKSCLKTIN